MGDVIYEMGEVHSQHPVLRINSPFPLFDIHQSQAEPLLRMQFPSGSESLKDSLLITKSSFQATCGKWYVAASRHTYPVLSCILSKAPLYSLLSDREQHLPHLIRVKVWFDPWTRLPCVIEFHRGSQGCQTLFLMATQFKRPPITDIHPSRKWTPR